MLLSLFVCYARDSWYLGTEEVLVQLALPPSKPSLKLAYHKVKLTVPLIIYFASDSQPSY